MKTNELFVELTAEESATVNGALNVINAPNQIVPTISGFGGGPIVIQNTNPITALDNVGQA
jgi:hypothetical protein